MINDMTEEATKEMVAWQIAFSMKDEHEKNQAITDEKKVQAVEVAKQAMARHVAHQMKSEIEAYEELK